VGAQWEANFFVIGAQKAGTTRLCNLLQRHPSVAIPFKEPFYFQSPDAMKGKAQWYRSIFEDVAHLPARGDGSTSYSMCGNYPGTAQRVHEFNPDARIIYMVRHPLRRIESGWRQSVSAPVSMSGDGTDVNGFLGFEHALYNKTELLIEPTLYWKQISEYRRYFADDQIRIGFFEEFIADEKTELRACLSFLGVDPIVDIEMEDDEDRNSSEGKRQRLGVVDAVRTLPGYERAKRFIPQPLKTLFTDRITRPIPTTSPWRQQSVAWTVSRVADDSAALLQYAGRSADYWSPWDVDTNVRSPKGRPLVELRGETRRSVCTSSPRQGSLRRAQGIFTVR